MRILAIDPGTTQSGWVIVRVENDAIIELEAKGITDNEKMFGIINGISPFDDQVWCEMIASQGMSVGQETYETCVWIGRFMNHHGAKGFHRATRNQIKLHLCGLARANDVTVTSALKDRFGPPSTTEIITPIGKNGLPMKPKKIITPGFTHGIHLHMWQALAVAAYAVDFNAGRVK